MSTDNNHAAHELTVDTAKTVAHKRPRPMTALQEAMFFGASFAAAILLQVAIVLRYSNVFE